jgi:hypothetical protein
MPFRLPPPPEPATPRGTIFVTGLAREASSGATHLTMPKVKRPGRSERRSTPGSFIDDDFALTP